MASAAPSENKDLVCLGPSPRGRGRPSSYTDAIADEICERLSAGETLIRICDDDHMPTIRTVMNWVNRRPDFFQKYARAREAQAHAEAEQMREIADNAYEDYYIDWKQDSEGNRVPFVVVNGESVKRAQLRIATRQWRAERLNRRAYGNSTRVEHSVADGPAHGEEGLPAGLSWLAGQLPEPQAAPGPEPDLSEVGEG